MNKQAQAAGVGDSHADSAKREGTAIERAPRHAYYALVLLTMANFFNYIDRNILSIVGQRIKGDLHLNDAQLGFLLGTAFAVFYGVIGVAMGRIADVLSRTRLMAFGLVIWSGMTALGAFSVGFASLAAARLGVGVGEATANPCSHSLLSEYFPARNRAAVLASYVLGTYLGLAFALIGGGLILQHWAQICTSLPGGACRMADWRAVLLVMGVPGVLLALPIALLREPGVPRRSSASSAIVAANELSAALPPFTLLTLSRLGGAPAVARNLVFTALLALAAIGMTLLVGDGVQWAAVAIGVYSVTTWAGILKRRDAPLHALTFGYPTFCFVAAGSALSACILGAVQAWSAPYAIRILGATPAAAGVSLGLTSAAAAGTSVVIGGFVTDIWKRRDPRAPVWITLISLLAPLPAFLTMMHATRLASFVIPYGMFMLLASLWAGPIAALIQDLVLPRMRGTAAAAFSLIAILVGSGVGPYWVGKISTMTGSLATGLYSVLVLMLPSAILLLVAAARVKREPLQWRAARAAAAGEPMGAGSAHP